MNRQREIDFFFCQEILASVVRNILKRHKICYEVREIERQRDRQIEQESFGKGVIFSPTYVISSLAYFTLQMSLCTCLRLPNISIHYGNYGYYHSIRSKYFLFKIKHCKFTASTMINPHMSWFENSVNSNHATSEKPADQELH